MRNHQRTAEFGGGMATMDALNRIWDWLSAIPWVTLGAVATAGLFAIGLLTLWAGLSDRRRAHAGHVAAWPDIDPEADPRNVVRVNWLNRADEPVWEVCVALGLYDAYKADFRILQTHRRHVLPPAMCARSRVNDLRTNLFGAMTDHALLAVQMTFRDRNGKTWRRLASGKLVRRHRRWLGMPRRTRLDEGDYLYRPMGEPAPTPLDDLLKLDVVDPTDGTIYPDEPSA